MKTRILWKKKNLNNVYLFADLFEPLLEIFSDSQIWNKFPTHVVLSQSCIIFCSAKKIGARKDYWLLIQYFEGFWIQKIRWKSKALTIPLSGTHVTAISCFVKPVFSSGSNQYCNISTGKLDCLINTTNLLLACPQLY